MMATIENYSVTMSVIAEKYRTFKARVSEYGVFVTILLYIVFSDALSVMDRVEHYVLHVDDAEVVAFLQSYISGFNMIGVAVRKCSVLGEFVLSECTGSHHCTGRHLCHLPHGARRLPLAR